MAAFPTTQTAEEAYYQILSYARQVKNWTAAQVTASQTDNANTALMILQFMANLAAANAAMSSAAAVTGVATFAQNSIGNSSFDIVGSYNGMAAAIANVVAWVKTNFPNSGGSPPYLLAVSFNADGSQAPRTFTASSLSGYLTQLQALAATMN